MASTTTTTAATTTTTSNTTHAGGGDGGGGGNPTTTSTSSIPRRTSTTTETTTTTPVPILQSYDRSSDDGTPSENPHTDLLRVLALVDDERHLVAYDLYRDAKNRVELAEASGGTMEEARAHGVLPDIDLVAGGGGSGSPTNHHGSSPTRKLWNAQEGVSKSEVRLPRTANEGAPGGGGADGSSPKVVGTTSSSSSAVTSSPSRGGGGGRPMKKPDRIDPAAPPPPPPPHEQPRRGDFGDNNDGGGGGGLNSSIMTGTISSTPPQQQRQNTSSSDHTTGNDIKSDSSGGGGGGGVSAGGRPPMLHPFRFITTTNRQQRRKSSKKMGRRVSSAGSADLVVVGGSDGEADCHHHAGGGGGGGCLLDPLNASDPCLRTRNSLDVSNSSCSDDGMVDRRGGGGGGGGGVLSLTTTTSTTTSSASTNTTTTTTGVVIASHDVTTTTNNTTEESSREGVNATTPRTSNQYQYPQQRTPPRRDRGFNDDDGGDNGNKDEQPPKNDDGDDDTTTAGGGGGGGVQLPLIGWKIPAPPPISVIPPLPSPVMVAKNLPKTLAQTTSRRDQRIQRQLRERALSIGKARTVLNERRIDFESLEKRALLFQKAKENLTVDDDWTFSQTLFGVSTHYRREEDGSLSVKIEGGLAGVPLFEQMAVLRECDLYHLWSPFCVESSKLAEMGRLEVVGWFNAHVPMLGLTRDAVYRAMGCDTMREDGSIMLVAEGIKSPPPGEDDPHAIQYPAWFRKEDVLSPMSNVLTSIASARDGHLKAVDEQQQQRHYQEEQQRVTEEEEVRAMANNATVTEVEGEQSPPASGKKRKKNKRGLRKLVGGNKKSRGKDPKGNTEQQQEECEGRVSSPPSPAPITPFGSDADGSGASASDSRPVDPSSLAAAAASTTTRPSNGGRGGSRRSVMTKTASMTSQHDDALSDVVIPPLPTKFGHARMEIRSFNAVIDVLSADSARTRIVANIDPNLKHMPQNVVDLITKKVCGVILLRIQATARKIIRDPVRNPHARRIRADSGFYRDWLLPKFKAYCDELGWEMPPVAAFEVEDEAQMVEEEEERFEKQMARMSQHPTDPLETSGEDADGEYSLSTGGGSSSALQRMAQPLYRVRRKIDYGPEFLSPIKSTEAKEAIAERKVEAARRRMAKQLKATPLTAEQRRRYEELQRTKRRLEEGRQRAEEEERRKERELSCTSREFPGIQTVASEDMCDEGPTDAAGDSASFLTKKGRRKLRRRTRRFFRRMYRSSLWGLVWKIVGLFFLFFADGPVFHYVDVTMQGLAGKLAALCLMCIHGFMHAYVMFSIFMLVFDTIEPHVVFGESTALSARRSSSLYPEKIESATVRIFRSGRRLFREMSKSVSMYISFGIVVFSSLYSFVLVTSRKYWEKYEELREGKLISDIIVSEEYSGGMYLPEGGGERDFFPPGGIVNSTVEMAYSTAEFAREAAALAVETIHCANSLESWKHEAMELSTWMMANSVAFLASLVLIGIVVFTPAHKPDGWKNRELLDRCAGNDESGRGREGGESSDDNDSVVDGKENTKDPSSTRVTFADGHRHRMERARSFFRVAGGNGEQRPLLGSRHGLLFRSVSDMHHARGGHAANPRTDSAHGLGGLGCIFRPYGAADGNGIGWAFADRFRQSHHDEHEKNIGFGSRFRQTGELNGIGFAGIFRQGGSDTPALGVGLGNVFRPMQRSALTSEEEEGAAVGSRPVPKDNIEEKDLRRMKSI